MVKFSGDAILKEDINEKLAVNLKVHKYIGSLKLEVPCMKNGFGSCYYEDFCSIFPQLECPEFFKSPKVAKGRYSIEDFSAYIELPVTPPTGFYEIKAEFGSESMGYVGCILATINIAKENN